MAAPQIGVGTSQSPSTIGLKKISVNATGVTGFSTLPVFIHSIEVGRPVIGDLPDILSRLGLYPPNHVTAATNKPKVKVRIDQGTGTYFDLPDLGKSWAESGVQEGHTVNLADAP